MKRNGRQIAFSGLMTALSLVLLYGSYLTQMMSTSFNVALCLVVYVSVLSGRRVESLFIYVATSVLGIVLVNIAFALPYIVFFGLYPLLLMLLEKLQLKKPLVYVLKAVYYNVVAVLIYFFAAVFTSDTILDFLALGSWTYIIYAAIATVILFLYDFLMSFARQPIINRMVRMRLMPPPVTASTDTTDKPTPPDSTDTSAPSDPFDD